MRTNVEWVPYRGWLSGQLGRGWVTGNVRDQTGRNPSYWLQHIGRKTVTVWIEDQDFSKDWHRLSSIGQVTGFYGLDNIGNFIRNNCDSNTNLIIHYNIQYKNNKDKFLMNHHDTRRYNLNMNVNKFTLYKNGFSGQFDFNVYYQNLRSQSSAYY